MKVALLTGGIDRPYVLGLAGALMAKGVGLDVVGSDELDGPELRDKPGLRFLNLRGDQREDAKLPRKIVRVISYYGRLLQYVAGNAPSVLHILWNNKFEYLDRTALLLYYRLLGWRIVLTAHNVNGRRRDGRDSLANRLSLWAEYRLADHIFVHTPAMRTDLVRDFGIPGDKVTVIPIGLNDTVPRTDLTPAEARQRLGVGMKERALLFFGHIAPYKGLDVLVAAFQELVKKRPDYRLIIAGRPKSGCEGYWREIEESIVRGAGGERVVRRAAFIPDADTEVYFKAADVLVLPYTAVFQSGVLVLGYNFGLPVIASDAGSLREDVVEGRTGFVCRARDVADLAGTINRYFESELFKMGHRRCTEIRAYAKCRYSWDVVGDATIQVYEGLIARRRGVVWRRGRRLAAR